MIATDCPECHATTRAAPRHYLLWICASSTGRNFYTFTCHGCHTPVAKPTVPILEKILVDNGVPRRMFTLPLELSDPERRDTRPLTADDHLDLLNELSAWDAHAA